MGPFATLCSVEIEHTYFVGGVCRGLRLEPARLSAQELGNVGCIWRADSGGIAVSYDVQRRDALEARLADRQQPFCVSILGRSSDPLFASYTEDLGADVPFFDSEEAVLDSATQRWQLRRRSAAWQKLLSTAERRVPPAFIVQIGLDSGDLQAAARRYSLSLQARATPWKYYLLGDWTQEQVRVVDTARQTEFSPPSPVALADGRTALAVRSLSAIPLRERSEQRLQLRGRNGSADKVLIKRLPVADAARLGRDSTGAAPTLVCEIYLHRFS